jgi:tRNA(Arg) A34 adenosine deaminase TadA
MLAQAIAEAIRAASKSTHSTFFHGCAVVEANTVVAVGHNIAFGEHAEVNAISRIHPAYRKGKTLYVARVTKGGKLASSRPCSACQSSLYHLCGIRRVYFSQSDGSWGFVKLNGIYQPGEDWPGEVLDVMEIKNGN